MLEESTNTIGRRGVLRGLTAAGAAGGFTSGVFSGTAMAQQGEASVTFNDQQTDGSTLTVAAVSTSVESRLLLVTGTSTVFKEVQLSAGESFSDRTFELDREVTQTVTIRAEIRTPFPEDALLAQDRARVTVGDGSGQASIRLVDANSEAGFNYPYFLYVPATDDDREVSMFVEPNNTGTSSDDFSTHQERARGLIEGHVRRIAGMLGVPALVPVFPRPRSEPVDWTHYTHQLDQDTLEIQSGPLERIDRQLLRMVDHAIETELADTAYSVRDDIMLNGFSASGNFVDRFTVLHAGRVRSVTAGGLNGMALLPLSEADGHTLDYHVGIADVEEITGESVELEALDSSNQLLYMGEDDTNDTIPYDDAWTSDELRQIALDVYGEDMIDERFPFSQQAYQEAGVTAQFRTYAGIGHRPPELQDLVEFHRRSMAGEDVSDFGIDVAGDPAGFVVTDPPTPAFEVASGTPRVGSEVEFDAGPTERGDTAIVKYHWRFGDGAEATGETVSHTYSDSGTFTVELVVEDFFGVSESTSQDISVSAEATDTPRGGEAGDSPGTAPPETTSADTGSGFTLLAAMASVSGAGYLIRRRSDAED